MNLPIEIAATGTRNLTENMLAWEILVQRVLVFSNDNPRRPSKSCAISNDFEVESFEISKIIKKSFTRY